jgi:hypothetical protein
MMLVDVTSSDSAWHIMYSNSRSGWRSLQPEIKALALQGAAIYKYLYAAWTD